jgi:DNA-binding transcriptional ArsR family regulator
VAKAAAQRASLSEDRLDDIFHALGDRTRRALLARLTEKPAMITELAEPFAISLPAVSKHIRVLEDAGLVSRTVEGRIHRCAFEPGPLRNADEWLRRYRRFWTENLESLARYVSR